MEVEGASLSSTIEKSKKNTQKLNQNWNSEPNQTKTKQRTHQSTVGLVRPFVSKYAEYSTLMIFWPECNLK